MFPPCLIDDADDEAFNMPVGRGPLRATALSPANSEDNVSGSGSRSGSGGDGVERGWWQ